MKIQLLTSAYNDLLKGRLFYEKQAEHLGDYFFDTLFADIDSLVLYGGIHPKCFGYYRMLSSRFPYAIYYKVDNNENIVVWRVLDCRQSPKKTERQLVY
ncbi:MAG: type II toxin-antitoxin system RelE/ParE family toxin [bacterium]|nr:type II toxin-antitoxin system RelE/ParE family toxin [bacterium]